MIPSIETEIVKKRKWLKSEEITDIFALSQTLPGAIAINSATFIGRRIAGVRGAVAALIGVSLPTFFIVLILGALYFFFKDSPKVEAAFLSIRVTVVAIIAYAGVRVAKAAIKDKTTLVITLLGIPALFFIHPILVLAAGAFSGVMVMMWKKKFGKKDDSGKPDKKPGEQEFEWYMGADI